MRQKRIRLWCGVCQIDVLVTIVCVTLLCVIASSVLGQEGPATRDALRSHPSTIKDAGQLRKIHEDSAINLDVVAALQTVASDSGQSKDIIQAVFGFGVIPTKSRIVRSPTFWPAQNPHS